MFSSHYIQTLTLMTSVPISMYVGNPQQLWFHYTFLFFFFFFFFNWRYNPWWVLACFTISFHNLLSLSFSLQFLTFIFSKSSSTCSRHLSLGLPTGLDEHGSHSVSFLTVLIVSILITCAAQRNLCDFINLTIVSFVIRISNVPLHQTRQYRETQVKVHDSNTYCTFFTLTYCFYRKHINIYMGWWMKSGTYVLKVCNCIAYVTLSITQTPKYT